METIEFNVFDLLDTPVFFVSVIASLGENCVLKAQTHCRKRRAEEKEAWFRFSVAQEGLTLLSWAQHVSPHLSLLCYQMKGSVLPGSLGCCKDEPTEVKCFEGEDFLGNAAAAFYY